MAMTSPSTTKSMAMALWLVRCRRKVLHLHFASSLTAYKIQRCHRCKHCNRFSCHRYVCWFIRLRQIALLLSRSFIFQVMQAPSFCHASEVRLPRRHRKITKSKTYVLSPYTIAWYSRNILIYVPFRRLLFLSSHPFSFRRAPSTHVLKKWRFIKLSLKTPAFLVLPCAHRS